MVKVGLTGGIGSGKTTVSNFLLDYGIPVYNSDSKGKTLMNTNLELKNNIVSIFGERVYDNGILNTNLLSSIVFNDSTKIEQLNNLVHPKVAQDFNQWVGKNNNKPILVKEAAILIESGAYLNMDKIILVVSEKSTRINRVSKRDNSDLDSIEKRINHQLTDNEKIKYADYIIENNSSLEHLKLEVLKVVNKIREVN
ncbi:MAG: dephospho-CoA kinase [Flavobacteriales bacterium]|nr:dephospho-CoA kinase [Flavobacteriales bacterium]MBL6868813.1 dephospho-CoA kinase [Flavobacteriales bacterium]